MNARLPRLLAPVLSLALFAACPSSETVGPVGDGGSEQDAGLTPPGCDSPEDCRAAGFDGVCREGLCKASVPCGDDAECGLGEACVSGACRFTGCVDDGDCAVGICRTDVFACTECGVNADCPANLPVCTDQGRCVKCQADAQCTYPGPEYCDVASGACVHCTADQQCPTGLKCGPAGICYGAQKNQGCSAEVACDLGLTCVNVGNNSVCLEACNLYVPQCPTGEICIKLTFQDSPSLVFDQGAPLGVCYPPVNGARGYREPCADNCQPNLECVPDSATVSSCRAYCDPAAPSCAPNEKCHPYPGDWSGHQYGLCYADNGYGDFCTGEADCRTGLSCVPRDDPSASGSLSNFCAFDKGSGGALAACTQHTQCGTGMCASDPVVGGATPFFCFAACAEDADCTADGRTGVCDGKFPVTTQYTSGTISGCRPTCTGPSACAGYGAAADQCRLSLDNQTLKTLQTCGAPVGMSALGSTCVTDGDCASGFCERRDGRGVNREGVCSTPCATAQECQGTGSCNPTSVLANTGADGTANTLDDRHVALSLCSGGACTRDADCSAPFARCTVDADPQNPLGNLVTVCRAASLGTKVAGDTCSVDAECASGACAEIVATGQKTCLSLCQVGGSDCAGAQSCVSNGARVRRADGSFQSFDACVP